MNRFLLFSALLFFVFSPIIADPEIPASAWEQHPEGIALAVTFFTHNENGPVSSIRVQIKNTANDMRYFVTANPWRAESQIFYKNAQGALVPLHDYKSMWRSVPEVLQSPMPPCPIIPGKILDITVDLTSPELTAIRGRPVICRVNISSREIGGYKLVESAPQILIGTQ